MAGLVTHLVLASEICKRLPEGTIGDRGLFYLGNLAPDAIHLRENYIREYKKHTHFRDDILDRDFVKEENRALFCSRVTDFIVRYREIDDGLLDLYRGYVVHVLADELYVVTVREEFCKTLEKLDIDQGDPRFFEYVVSDMTRNDFLLAKYYTDFGDIFKGLEEAKVYPVAGYLSEDEIYSCRDWLLHRYIKDTQEILQPTYITFEETLDFIQRAADEIVERLTGGKNFPAMF
jgi:hypothetical protein